jgi:hypothetical protein
VHACVPHMVSQQLSTTNAAVCHHWLKNNDQNARIMNRQAKVSRTGSALVGHGVALRGERCEGRRLASSVE